MFNARERAFSGAELLQASGVIANREKEKIVGSTHFVVWLIAEVRV
jgi:hypothetical protein